MKPTWESFGVFRFDLGPLIEGQTRIAKVKSVYNLLLVLEIWDGNQPIGNHGLGIF